MSNTILNPSIIAKEALRQLANSCVMGSLVFRGYEEEFTTRSRGWKVGSSITVKAPVYFRTHHARDITSAKVDLLERSTTFTVDRWVGVAWTLNAEEMSLNIDKFSKRFLQPAMQAIANDIDRYLLELYKYIPAQIGNPGTTPDDYLTYALAAAKLSDAAVPMNDRRLVINPTTKAYLSDHLKGTSNPEMAKKIIEKAYAGPIAGFDAYESQNVYSHTSGTTLTAYVDDAAGGSEGDTTVTIDNGAGDWTTTVAAGDIFTVAGVYAVNPITGAAMPYYRQFCVNTAASADGTETALDTTPGADPYKIYSAGATSKYLPYQTVDALVADDAAVTFAHSSSGQVYPVNLAFHKDCLGLCMVPLEIPESMEWKAVESYDGYTIAVSRYTNGDTLTETIRLDALLGRKVLNPFMGIRIAG